MAVESFVPQPLLVTPAAVKKIQDLNSQEEQAKSLRVYVTGGGCSGFQYGFGLEDAPKEDDLVIEQQGVSLLLDDLSRPYLEGSTVDYQEGLEGAKFVLLNIQGDTCSCGVSFSA